MQTIQCYKNAFFKFENQRVISLNKKRVFEQIFFKIKQFHKVSNKSWIFKTLWYDYFKLIIITQKNHIFELIHKNVNIDVNHITINADNWIEIFIDVIVIRIEIIDIFWLSIVVVIIVVIIVTIINEFYIEKFSIVISILLFYNLSNKLNDEFNELFSLNIEKILILIVEFELKSNIKFKWIKIKIKLFLILILCIEKSNCLKIEKINLIELKFEFWHDDIFTTYFFNDFECWCNWICVKKNDDLKKFWNVWIVWNV